MTTSKYLGLKIWNSSNDDYTSGQLAENWARLDEHDHANGRGKQIPTGGIADAAITPDKLSASIRAVLGL